MSVGRERIDVMGTDTTAHQNERAALLDEFGQQGASAHGVGGVAGGENALDAEGGDAAAGIERVAADVEGTVKGDGAAGVPGVQQTADGRLIDIALGGEGTDDDGVHTALTAVGQADAEVAAEADAACHGFYFFGGIYKVACAAADEDIHGNIDCSEGVADILLGRCKAVSGKVFAEFNARSTRQLGLTGIGCALAATFKELMDHGELRMENG